MTQPCERTWEAEAVLDARLDAVARASFERHLLVCTTCAQERATLARLRSMAEEVAETNNASSLDRRRLRAAILRQANIRILTKGRRAGVRPQAIALAAAIAAVAWIGVHKKNTPPASTEVSPLSSQPVFEVGPQGSASWRVDRPGPEVEVSLAPPPTTPAPPQQPRAAASRGKLRLLPNPESGSSSEVKSAGTLFKQAMAAFSAGSYETADALFKSFEQQFPGDARSEDASFLRIVICKRLGNASAAPQRERAYLTNLVELGRVHRAEH